MNCKNCNNKIENDANFCHICGNKNNANNMDELSATEKMLFYSKDWERTKVFTLSVLPRFDILITDRFLYLIALPKSLTHDIGGMFGVLGSVVSNSAEKKAGNKLRSAWLNSDQQLISCEYKKKALLKIPKENIKSSLLLKKGFRQKLAIFTYEDKKIYLQGNKTEYDRLKNYIESQAL